MLAAAMALAAHLALIGVLALGIRGSRPPNESPAIEVTLTRLFTPHPQPKPAAATQRRPATRAAPPTAAPPPPSPAPQPSPVALPENGPVDPRIAAAEAVRGALQQVVRCAHPDEFNMSPSERESCARRNRQMAADAPTYTVDPADHARHDPLVASHGMAMKDHLSPRPGNPLGPPPPCPHVWCQNTNIQPGPNIY